MKICSISRRLLKALKSKKVRLALDFAIITLIGLAIFRNFLFSGYWPAGGDILGWISREYLFGHDFRWAYTWRPHSFGFSENIYIIDLFYMILHFLLNNPVFLIKLVMFLSFIFAGFSAYIFAFRYTRNNLASLSAALVYTLNQWVASQLTEAHLAILISYVIFPAIFLLFDRALTSGKLRHSLLLSFGLVLLVAGFHPECTIIYGTTLALFLTIYLIYPSNSEPFIFRVKRALKVTLISATFAFFLSAFFTIPFILNVNAPYFSTEYSYFIEDCYNISYKNVTDAFVLRAIENWGYVNVLTNVYSGLALKNFPIYTLLSFIFSLAILVVFIFKPNRHTIFFIMLLFISIVIAMGPYSFLGEIFVWAWFNVPHFAVFRAASRWVMIAALAHSYFISNLVSLASNYLPKKSEKTIPANHSNLNEVEMEKRNKKFKSFILPFGSNTLNFKKVKKFAKFSGIFLILIILISGFVSCAFLFSQGLQVHRLPKHYTAPYYWISNQTGDFKIVTVNNSPAEWECLEAETDFAFPGMLTEIGWWHDIGYESPFIHDKPVLQDGGWSFPSRWFVDYLRFKVARQSLTENLFKILGIFGYKYIVIPCYAKERIREFFMKQKGGEIVYNCSNSLILENKFYTPRFFAAKEKSIVVGGLESFLTLTKMENFNFSRNALFFGDKNEVILKECSFKDYDFLIFVNSDILDLIMLSMKDSLIKASDYGFKSINYTKYWVKWLSWRTAGGFVYWGDVLTTNGKNIVKIPFNLEKDGNYTLWIRIAFAPHRGKLTITLDELFERKIKTEANFWSKLQWINLTSLKLKRGSHIITIKNDGTGFNDIDAIAIIENSKFQEQKRKILEAIENSEFSILYLIEAENNFLKTLDSVWKSEPFPYNDCLIYPLEKGKNIAYLGNVSASSESDAHMARNAVDGDLTTRWASLKGLPQWIQIEWEEKQKIRGVKINFEWAYAREYAIQVWNGTAWINWLTVKENNEYKRIHVFPRAVETDKIRILFTNAPAYNMVSIWELEVYSEQIVTEKTKIYITREGNCQFFARVFKGPQYGVLHLAVDDKILNASCYSENLGFEWLNLGSLYLGEGEHEIGIGATGDVELDLIAVASTKDGKQLDSLAELFQESAEKPVVSFERINPCLYKVHVEAEEPFILVFSDSYHPLWRAILDDGTEIKPVNLYHIVNGFFINKTGKFDLTVRFIGQDYVDLGFKVSLATFIVVLVLLAIPERTYLKIRKKIVDLKREDYS